MGTSPSLLDILLAIFVLGGLTYFVATQIAGWIIFFTYL